MRYVSDADAANYKLRVPSRRKIATAIKEYLNLAITHDEASMLRGLSVNIINLDTAEIEIGDGMIDKNTRTYSIISSKVAMQVIDIKKQLVIGERYPEDYKPDDTSDLQNVLENGSPAEVALAAALMRLIMVAGEMKANLPYSIRSKVNETAKKIETSKLNEPDCSLYNNSWFKGFVARTLLKENADLKGYEKQLVEAVIAVCRKFDELGYKSVDGLLELFKGRCVKAYGIKSMGSTRAATKSEIERNVGNLFVGTANMLEDPDMYRMMLFVSIVTGSNNYKFELEKLSASDAIKKLGADWAACFSKSEGIESFIRRRCSTIVNRLNEIIDKAETYVQQLRIGTTQILYPDTVEPRFAYIQPAVYTLDEAIRAVATSKTNKVGDLAVKIAKECLSKNDMSLSEKQLDVITRAYYNITCGNIPAGVDMQEAARIAKELLKKYSDKLTSVVNSIARGVLDKGICSEKQLDVIRRALDSLNIESTKSEPVRQVSVDALADKIFSMNSNAKDPGTEKSKEELAKSGEAQKKESKTGMPIPKPVFSTSVGAGDGSADDMIANWFN